MQKSIISSLRVAVEVRINHWPLNRGHLALIGCTITALHGLLTRCHTRPVAAAIGLRGWGCVCHTPMTTAQPLIGPQKISGFSLEFYKNGVRLGVRTTVARHQGRRAPLAQDLWRNLDFSGLAYPHRWLLYTMVAWAPKQYTQGHSTSISLGAILTYLS